MINLKVGDIDCQLPSEWNEIKLKDYSKIYSIIKSDSFVEPDEDASIRSEAENKVLDTQRGLHNIKLNRKLFSKLTGIEESIINKVDAKEMSNTLTLMTNFLNGNVEEMAIDEGSKRSFEYNKKTYFYPVAEMRTSTFGDFIEAAQLDMLAEKDEAGKFGVIAEQMAILCRERGEDYDEQKVIKKTKLFENLTMNEVWGFVFFLNKQINTYKKNIQTFSNQETETTTGTPPIIGLS
tara:strand:+ start:2447 stop:3154 length:708 start_codon:yes stop_codon:yes gene_type:complete